MCNIALQFISQYGVMILFSIRTSLISYNQVFKAFSSLKQGLLDRFKVIF